MNKIFLLLLTTCIGLSACKPTENTPASTSGNDSETATQTATDQTITSTDGEVNIQVKNGSFQDILSNQAAHPTGIKADQLTLLQYDENLDATLYVVNFGSSQTEAKPYFESIKNNINNAQNLQNVQIGVATDNRMNFRFTQNDSKGNTLNESCVAIRHNNIYTICATSPTASQDNLADLLKSVNFLK